MLYAVSALDKADHLAVRMENRPAHLDFLNANTDRIRIAGPYLSGDDGDPIGSFLIVEADSEPAVEALLAQDPYAKAGLFDTVEIRPWKWVVGAPQ